LIKSKAPTVKDLRGFGYVMAGGISLFFGILIPLIWHRPFRARTFIIALIFLVLGRVYPQSLKHIYIAWMKIGGVLGWINSRIILSAVFYVIIAPVGLFRRIFFRADPLRLKMEKSVLTYRVNPDSHNMVAQMEKPY
jgi:hypothetical protein